MYVQWMAFCLITLATAVLLVRFFFMYSEYVRLSHLPRKTEATPVSTEQASAKNEAEKASNKTKSKPVKKSAKKKPAKKSKKKKG